ncbi:MAG: phosphoenolpyruvate synthase [Myxococcales bacterium]|nr:MAG: phosphoenolpyruvate synthase [Myxococcales bacterium]
MASFVLPLAEVTLEDLPRVGGKNASLGEMIGALSQSGVRVPDGFALTVDAFHAHLRGAGLEAEIQATLDRLDPGDIAALAEAGARLRCRVAEAPLPKQVAEEAQAAYSLLSGRFGEAETDVAVRSSATAEDLPTASFAGQQESFLNVRGANDFDVAIRRCMASLYTDRAIVYRHEQGIAHGDVALSVGVQKMVRSDRASAGVIFTLDTESGFRDVVLVTGSFGLGELVVQGRVNPDEFWVHKPTLAAGFRAIVRRERGEKATKLVYGDLRAVKEMRVAREERLRFVLSDDEVLELARWAVAVERHYSERAGHPVPMDLEWAKDGRSGELFVVQARPETVHSRSSAPKIELFRLRGTGRLLVSGKAVGSRVGVGPVRVIRSTSELVNFQPGEVLVAGMTDPDWEPVLARAAALVTDQGGRTCHAAIVSRELGLPCVVGTGKGSRVLRDGDRVTVFCAEGDTGRVYEGELPVEREEIDPATLPESPVPLMLNLANPDLAFQLAQLPSAGVGLLRIEFLVNHWIGIHPMALVHPERVDEDVRAEILRRTEGWPKPSDHFVERMASGVGVIAAAFHPRPVIVRFSDFKSNEYAGLIGGKVFEPVEANPMLGFRGASRYTDERYREGFALECRAICRVREEMGLENVKVMIPFCRTLGEARRVQQEMAKHGLVRGEKGLEVWVMCEIPNNVVLAEEFAQLFDGFSIGSNDLTQLVLGIDRDSEILAPLFDERDPGVLRMIETVVERAHRAGRRVGICGQAPSDHPDLAVFLAKIGIDSISLVPDSLPRVARRLAGA